MPAANFYHNGCERRAMHQFDWKLQAADVGSHISSNLPTPEEEKEERRNVKRERERKREANCISSILNLRCRHVCYLHTQCQLPKSLMSKSRCLQLDSDKEYHVHGPQVGGCQVPGL